MVMAAVKGQLLRRLELAVVAGGFTRAPLPFTGP
jgi:hypothetical protein